MDGKTKIEVDAKTARLFEKFCKHEQDFNWLHDQGMFNRPQAGKSRKILVYQDKRGYFAHFEETIIGR